MNGDTDPSNLDIPIASAISADNCSANVTIIFHK